MQNVKLASVCKFKQWHTIPTKKLQEEGYPVWGANGIIGYTDTYNHEQPTIMICCRGATCGSINVSEGKCYINGNAMCLDNLSDDFLLDYVKYYLKHYDFSSIITGAAQPQITQIGLQKILIPCRSLNDQKEIVDTLARLEHLKDYKKIVLKSLDELVKSRFIEMFGKYFEDENNLCKLEKICNATIGLTYKPTNVSQTGTIVLRSGNIQSNELYLLDDIVRVSNIKINDDKYIHENDILMCSRNGSARLVGKSCLITKIPEPMSFGAFMTVIRCEYPYFLQAFFSSDYFKQQLTGTQTASVNQITTKMLYNYVVIKPKKEEENTFAEFVKQVDKSKFVVSLA